MRSSIEKNVRLAHLVSLMAKADAERVDAMYLRGECELSNLQDALHEWERLESKKQEWEMKLRVYDLLNK